MWDGPQPETDILLGRVLKLPHFNKGIEIYVNTDPGTVIGRPGTGIIYCRIPVATTPFIWQLHVMGQNVAISRDHSRFIELDERTMSKLA